jgi:hypothetical protein
MPRVFYMPRTRSTRVLWILEEIGKPYEVVQIAREERRSLSIWRGIRSAACPSSSSPPKRCRIAR